MSARRLRKHCAIPAGLDYAAVHPEKLPCGLEYHSCRVAVLQTAAAQKRRFAFLRCRGAGFPPEAAMPDRLAAWVAAAYSVHWVYVAARSVFRREQRRW